MEIRFTDAFWSRLLTELKASDVFASRVSDVGSLHDAIQGATILNPANLEITAAGEHQPSVRCAIHTYLSLRRLGLENLAPRPRLLLPKTTTRPEAN